MLAPLNPASPTRQSLILQVTGLHLCAGGNCSMYVLVTSKPAPLCVPQPAAQLKGRDCCWWRQRIRSKLAAGQRCHQRQAAAARWSPQAPPPATAMLVSGVRSMHT
jgi:hypothetical protein